SEAPEAIFPNSPEDSGQPAELGQIVNLEMPPNAEPLPPTNQEGVMGPELPAEPFNRNNIRTKEKLEPSGIREVDHLIGKLDRDQDIASFYDAARKMMTANLENSYGDQAIWKGKAA
ncbi:hypothetical protein J6W91_00380, partial [Candidatus Saccharibacteria bacterium]|nr:hypothetical protein [Candidatus Saccharibacteria bacterium]